MAKRTPETDVHARRAISDRLRTYIREHYRNANQFREILGIPHTTVAGWLRAGNPTLPSASQLALLAARTSISLDWLLMGKGSPTSGIAAPTELDAQLRAQLYTELARRGYSARQLEFLDHGPGFLGPAVIKLLVANSLRLAQGLSGVGILPDDHDGLPHHRLPTPAPERLPLTPQELDYL